MTNRETPNIPCQFTCGPDGCFCHCGFGSKGMSEPPTCWKCPSRGEKPLRIIERMMTIEEATACVHRGRPLRDIGCEFCGARGDELVIFECDNPEVDEKECTASIRGKSEGVAICLGCDHRVEPEDA